MSTRMLLELLAGEKSVQEFENAYRMKPHENPFRRMLSAGRPISKVTVEPQSEQDDDLVTIEFGAPDPAFAPFRV